VNAAERETPMNLFGIKSANSDHNKYVFTRQPGVTSKTAEFSPFVPPAVIAAIAAFATHEGIRDLQIRKL